MKKIISKSFLLLLFLTASCGFKVVNESEKNNFSIQKIETSGEKRISFKIKNNLLADTKKNSQNSGYGGKAGVRAGGPNLDLFSIFYLIF